MCKISYVLVGRLEPTLHEYKALWHDEGLIMFGDLALSFKVIRAYPGSEFVVANTLAKWKKFEPNEIDFSQGIFSQKVVSKSCSVFNSLPASNNFCHLLKTFANSSDPDQARQNVGPDLDPNCLTP